MLDADVVHEVEGSGRLLLVLFEVDPVFLVGLDEALAHEVLLVEFHFVRYHVQDLAIFCVCGEECWHTDAVFVYHWGLMQDF